jgi:hypothetical protein
VSEPHLIRYKQSVVWLGSFDLSSNLLVLPPVTTGRTINGFLLSFYIVNSCSLCDRQVICPFYTDLSANLRIPRGRRTTYHIQRFWTWTTPPTNNSDSYSSNFICEILTSSFLPLIIHSLHIWPTLTASIRIAR